MKLKKWLPVALGSIIALGSSVAAQADATLDKIEQRHVLVGGVLLSGGPFGGIDPAPQKPKGLNVDLANEMGRQLKAEVQLVPVLPANRCAVPATGQGRLADRQYGVDRRAR